MTEQFEVIHGLYTEPAGKTPFGIKLNIHLYILYTNILW